MPESSVELRKCKQCGIKKTLNKENFTPRIYRKKMTHFFDNVCRKCANEYRKNWMRANRSRYAEQEADWYQNNKARISAKQKERYHANPAARDLKLAGVRAKRAMLTEDQRRAERARGRLSYYRDLTKTRSYYREWMRKWREQNPDKSRLSAKRQKARRRGATVETITKAQIETLFKNQRGRCAICAKKIEMATKHIDHIKAIAQGGKHEIGNLQLTCAACNMTKQDKDPIDFMQKLGFLL